MGRYPGLDTHFIKSPDRAPEVASKSWKMPPLTMRLLITLLLIPRQMGHDAVDDTAVDDQLVAVDVAGSL